MIYELALVSYPDLGDEKLAKVKSIVEEVIKQDGGDIAVQDDWGMMNLAQPTEKGLMRAVFSYFIYKASAAANAELVRRFGITEGVLNNLIIRLGEDNDLDKIVKGFKCPYSKNYNGSITENIEEDRDRDRGRRFSRSKACWFATNEISPDWKDPGTFSWLVNEFGKISPARVSGISSKAQHQATVAIKRARQLGVASYMTNKQAYQ